MKLSNKILLKVKIEAPEKILQKIEAAKSDDLLLIKFTQDFKEFLPTANVHLAVPKFEFLKAEGKARFIFNHFNLPRLEIHSDGYLEIEGKKNQLDNFRFEHGGLALVNLTESTVQNLDLDFYGAGRAKFHLTQGKITGEIGGTLLVEYSGEIIKEDVESYGLAGVRKLKE